ncbi:MAG: SulP family inorganic anion transporter, partial [Myxococcales bacterium]|nr:SulP family inorganic anion transporter [Myxococcales bacterium]
FKNKWMKKVPAPLVVLLVTVPLGLAFALDHAHTYSFNHHAFNVGPQHLVSLPGSLIKAVATPDFSMVTSAVSIKYVVMFALVGTVESLLSVSAVDALDPEKRASDLNKDLLATGIGNTIAAAVGGLPMISEIVRSKANIDAGAKSRMSNFFHGGFLLLFVALVPGLLHRIPLAALGAMLVYTGTRLASPSEFVRAYKVGPEQLLLFLTTFVVTLATDLLVGVGVGLLLKLVLHLKNGAPIKSLFRVVIDEQRAGDVLLLKVHDAAIFTNLLGLKKRLDKLDDGVKKVVVDFGDTWVVDHTVFERLHAIEREWPDRELEIVGLDGHVPSSSHAFASRRRPRAAA